MGKSSPKAPAAPDPVATSAAQTQMNKDTAYWNAVLNNVNQITPYGNLTYTQTGGGKTYNEDAYNQANQAYNTSLADYNSRPPTGMYGNNPTAPTAPRREDYLIGEAPPQFTSKIDLSPEQQALYNSQVGQQQQLMDLGGQQIGRIQQSANTPFSFAGIGNEVTAEGVAEAQARTEEALMNRLAPQFGRDEEALRSRLINQGISQGSEAYNREFDSFGQKQNDARMQAILSATQYGGELQNQALARRNQGIQEYTTQRNAPLNEYIGFTSGTQIQNPQFQNTSYQGAQGVDYAGLVNQKYQGDLGAYNSKVAGNNSTMSSLFGLGGSIASGYAGSQAGSAAISALLMSDIRLKEDISPAGFRNGFKLYDFSYIGDSKKYRGVMAQDIEATHPHAVVTMPSGFKAVDYGILGISMEIL